MISAAGAKADMRPHTNHQLEFFNNTLDASKVYSLFQVLVPAGPDR